MSIIWKILTGLLLSLSLTFTALFQNQVEWILPAFFSWRHLYASWWFSWHMLSDMKSLPENLCWRRSSDLFRRFFLLTSTLRLSFLHLHFTITDSFFFKRWQACKSSGLTSCPVKESALQMFTSSSSSLIDGGTGLPPPILANGTEHLWLQNSTSIRRRNSTWKVRRNYIDFERRIHVEIMTSIRRWYFDVDSTFKINEISMSSPRAFFMSFQRQIDITSVLAVYILSFSNIFCPGNLF